MAIYYMGCWNGSGHSLYSSKGTRPYPSPFPGDKLGGKYIDCGFAPGILPPFNSDPRNIAQGAAVLHHVDGWTILSFWDRSGDSRPGSHSTYVIEGDLSFDDALVQSKTAFPTIWKRYTFPVVLWDGTVTGRGIGDS